VTIPTTERTGIISAGTWTIDRIKVVDHWPDEEHLAQIIATDIQGGGSGHNLAVDIRKLDSSMPVEVIGLVGNDNDGELLLEYANASGVCARQLHRTDANQTAFTDVVCDNVTGKRTFFHYPGTSDHLSPEHFNLDLCEGRWLHLGLLGVHKIMDSKWQEFENGWVAVLAAAKQHGIATNLELVSIDEKKIRAIAKPCLAYLDSLIINEYELGALAGMPVCNHDGIVDIEKCTKAAQSLISQGSMSVVVVHFPEAAIAVTTSGEILVRDSFEVHPSWIKSTVGAGDAFAAGMLYGLHESWSLDASVELGHASAAASLRAATTVDSVQSIQACLEFARQAHIASDHDNQLY